MLIVFGNAGGNLLLALGMTHTPSPFSMRLAQYIVMVLTNGFLVGGTALTLMSTLAQLSMYTWADLSYILPVTASGYVITAILSKFFLAEHVTIFRWTGVVIISFGVFFVAHTPPDTKHVEETPDANTLEEASK